MVLTVNLLPRAKKRRIFWFCYELLDKILHFLNEDQNVPVSIKIAIVYDCFAYIHPFYDGNGRLSFLLTSIYLRELLGIFCGFDGFAIL